MRTSTGGAECGRRGFRRGGPQCPAFRRHGQAPRAADRGCAVRPPASCIGRRNAGALRLRPPIGRKMPGRREGERAAAWLSCWMPEAVPPPIWQQSPPPLGTADGRLDGGHTATLAGKPWTAGPAPRFRLFKIRQSAIAWLAGRRPAGAARIDMRFIICASGFFLGTDALR